MAPLRDDVLDTMRNRRQPLGVEVAVIKGNQPPDAAGPSD